MSLSKIFACIIAFFVVSFKGWALEPCSDKRQQIVLNRIAKAKTYIQTYGKEKAILKFQKSSSHIFALSYSGMVLASPIHPETVGTNQFNFKDASGMFAVQEEINLAKAGGGWIKGRYRPNHKTGKYECRRLYIQPMGSDYFIGSWYHYTAFKNTCPI